MIRAIVENRPEIIANSDRSLTLSELVDIGDYDSAKNFLVEKEIETVMRKSHTDHFDWLEAKLSMKLRKELPSWKNFIELTERRNLLVHCDGLVSHQYLSTCRENGIKCDGCKVGEKLTVPPKYFREACDTITEIAVKLVHVIWRKLIPSQREAADDSLNLVSFELIVHENYRLAENLLEFATETLKTHSSDRSRLTFVVNLAQCYKWNGSEKKCLGLLAGHDWSARGLDFQLCEAVLTDDAERTEKLMRQIGSTGAMSDQAYREWPVFRKVRKEEFFQKTYRDVFGEEMKLGESSVQMEMEQVKDFIQQITGKRLMFIEAPSEPDEDPEKDQSQPSELE